MNTEALIYLIIIAVSILLILTIGRMLVLWFMKIEKRIDNQEKIIRRLDVLIKNTNKEPAQLKEENGTSPKLTI